MFMLTTKLGQKDSDDQYPDEEEADGEVKWASSGGGSNRGGGGIAGGLDITTPGGLGRLCEWPSSRIVRVSRTSGGNDRYSKVWTSKGLRYRRVRLSVNTAIQFYDLQDRLGYDQPSKAVEWLLKAAVSGFGEGLGRLCGWPSSRIVRVSRASGGKDRHSKVLTSKGLRDRRVRLSASTAIQFYDLQDRLGYDQPSTAVEWLFKAAVSVFSTYSFSSDHINIVGMARWYFPNCSEAVDRFLEDEISSSSKHRMNRKNQYVDSGLRLFPNCSEVEVELLSDKCDLEGSRIKKIKLMELEEEVVKESDIDEAENSRTDFSSSSDNRLLEKAKMILRGGEKTIKMRQRRVKKQTKTFDSVDKYGNYSISFSSSSSSSVNSPLLRH